MSRVRLYLRYYWSDTNRSQQFHALSLSFFIPIEIDIHSRVINIIGERLFQYRLETVGSQDYQDIGAYCVIKPPALPFCSFSTLQIKIQYVSITNAIYGTCI
jgi:hypothetical protein